MLPAHLRVSVSHPPSTHHGSHPNTNELAYGIRGKEYGDIERGMEDIMTEGSKTIHSAPPVDEFPILELVHVFIEWLFLTEGLQMGAGLYLAVAI